MITSGAVIYSERCNRDSIHCWLSWSSTRNNGSFCFALFCSNTGATFRTALNHNRIRPLFMATVVSLQYRRWKTTQLNLTTTETQDNQLNESKRFEKRKTTSLYKNFYFLRCFIRHGDFPFFFLCLFNIFFLFNYQHNVYNML